MERNQSALKIPVLPHQATIVGRVVNTSISQPPTWVDVVREIQRWS